MKIVIDEQIPYIGQSLNGIADEVVFMPGKAITADVVRDADALIIRTRTRCNRALLEGSKVKFIATATIGFDHIDTDYCREAGIEWTNAPGCNATSVEQYLESALIIISRHAGRPLSEMTLGIVGVGHVGSRVAEMARSHGMKVLLNDPPRAEKEGCGEFVPLSVITEEADIVSFHTPLIREGERRTYHLADSGFFASLKRRPYIINSSRGEVVDTQAINHAMAEGIIAQAVIDVWENEPRIDGTLLREAMITTPHIAGYSADGKVNATRMSLEALFRFFKIDADLRIEAPVPPQSEIAAPTIDDFLLKVYNPTEMSERLKVAPETFEEMRNNYPFRREREAFRFIKE